ncbi:KpsF/GutQ family sugar-phosphate isomerase [Acidiphilium iwatense]|uniref:KpsF/GutQ family sugar-phosphate isomerase n=1 Tax=Acidiphilium iwatense TaxID=768198 RepID=A0ABS9DSL0_9PROT|nr:KpsF/GutQ family sugar-phosphate isomerase [Acidiphilium iwatense]MCF3945726.1 KpsF/GutQ family sugar-phosphate isomerase [Acidiphilium iwatense]
MTSQTVRRTETRSRADRSPGEIASDVPELEIARDVLMTEAAALSALADSLGAPFAAAMDVLHGVAGRVVVTGMGKSGHVARKIAATLASTGTPALFVHPAEASHGDLGMIVPGDAVLALSNGGEAAELAAIVTHARRFALKLIAITARADSTLARAADLVLLLPPAPEAGPIGLAPTTSTTMQMALGDALAVTLMMRRRLTAAEFGQFHPGGTLGARLKRVRELMHEGDAVPLAGPETTMDRAILRITEKHFGCLGVVDAERRLLGIVTDGDLRRAMAPELLGRRVDAVMTSEPRVIGPDALAEEALHDMTALVPKVTSLFVVDAERCVLGIVHIHDLLRAGVA